MWQALCYACTGLHWVHIQVPRPGTTISHRAGHVLGGERQGSTMCHHGPLNYHLNVQSEVREAGRLDVNSESFKFFKELGVEYHVFECICMYLYVLVRFVDLLSNNIHIIIAFKVSWRLFQMLFSDVVVAIRRKNSSFSPPTNPRSGPTNACPGLNSAVAAPKARFGHGQKTRAMRDMILQNLPKGYMLLMCLLLATQHRDHSRWSSGNGLLGFKSLRHHCCTQRRVQC